MGMGDNIIKEMFLFPGHDQVVTIESRNFSIAKVYFCRGFYWSAGGCNLAVHSSCLLFIYSEKRVDNNPAAEGFLGLRIVLECRNSSDVWEWGQGALQIGFPFFRKKISILEMEWSRNLLRKPEFRDNSGKNGNRKFSSLRHVNRKNFRFTEWKP